MCRQVCRWVLETLPQLLDEEVPVSNSNCRKRVPVTRVKSTIIPNGKLSPVNRTSIPISVTADIFYQPTTASPPYWCLDIVTISCSIDRRGSKPRWLFEIFLIYAYGSASWRIRGNLPLHARK
jgi:hypothetical protein